ncbi:hypothetical protein GCM10009416_03320 [Craurococcus roseus]|uniref:Uncharacterized protein n=1 Tax=Craurococcus roseus TaxID=77585 RepID=A0ABN1EKL4_9PROT
MLIYTADEELTVEFGRCITILPTWRAEGEDDATAEEAASAAEDAQRVVSRWLDGELMTAVHSDGNSKWCGSTFIEPGGLLSRLKGGADWIRVSSPVQVELRRARRTGWRKFSINGDVSEEIGAEGF